jgi:hypothetical protein
VERTFDVGDLSTKNRSLIEHVCVRIKCNKFFLYISVVYLAPNVIKRAYDLFVEEIEAITDNRDLCDRKLDRRWTNKAALCCP